MDDQQGNETLVGAAYTVGFFLGDGGLYCQPLRNAWRIVFTKQDLECVERVQAQVWREFDLRGNMRMDSGGVSWKLEFYSKKLYDFLAFNTAFRTQIPQDYFFMEGEPLQELLAGLFDSDGSVTYTEAEGYPRWQLQFTSTERHLAEGVHALVERFGVRPNRIVEVDTKHKRVYHVRPNMLDFYNAGLYFRSERKQRRLQDYINHVHASETLYADAREA
jgi:hypothetical protein